MLSKFDDMRNILACNRYNRKKCRNLRRTLDDTAQGVKGSRKQRLSTRYKRFRRIKLNGEVVQPY